MDLSKIKELLYDEANGIFFRLRNGDYSILPEEKEQILSFARYCNTMLKEGNLPTDVASIAIDIIHSLPEYSEDEWTKILVEKAVVEMEKGIES